MLDFYIYNEEEYSVQNAKIMAKCIIRYFTLHIN